MPQLPQLRGLQLGARRASMSESYLPSTPRSGHFRAHPYHPVGDVAEGSSNEFVPSTVAQAPCAQGTDSMNVTPISSPMLSTRIQVISPNLALGSAAEVIPPWEEEPVMELALAREILQTWTENQTEDGSIERRCTQVARTWPLEDNVDLGFDNIEAAIQVLRQACDCLHQGMRHVGSVVEKKADAERVQNMANAICEVVDQVKRIHEQLLEGCK